MNCFNCIYTSECIPWELHVCTDVVKTIAQNHLQEPVQPHHARVLFEIHLRCTAQWQNNNIFL